MPLTLGAAHPLRLIGFVFERLRGEGADIRRAALACSMLVVGSAILNATAPLALSRAIDGFGAEAAAPLALLSLYALLLWLGKALSELQWAVYGPVEQRMSRNLSRLIFDRVQSLPFSYHVSKKTGELARIINRSASAAQAVLLNCAFFVFPIGIELICVCAILAAQTSIFFALIMAFSVVIYGLLVIRGTEELRRISRDTNAENTRAHGIAFDGVANFETIKYFGAENWLSDRLDTRLSAAERMANRRQVWRAWLGVAQWSILAATAAILILAAGFDVLRGRMSVGDIVLINAYVLRVVRPLNNLGRIYRILRLALIDLENVQEIVSDTAREDMSRGNPLPPGQGAIAFHNVRFGYGDEHDVFSNVSFAISPNETVGIVGASGSGKSTLTRLMFRFYKPHSGEICLDGAPYSTLSTDTVRAAISIVPQDTVLFNETLRDNITIANPSASLDTLHDAVRRAQLEPLINRLPQGWDTIVGERGKVLSGGERQRVAIARALLKAPRVLILDEATSALDTVTERALMDALQPLKGQMTMIVIAHRLSTVTWADRVLVLEDGRVAEEGDPTRLRQKGGYYARLWQAQFGGPERDCCTGCKSTADANCSVAKRLAAPPSPAL